MKYIGARYVPKFMGSYDATQSYEALCVVDNGSGTSYITNKPTPAGTPLTDTNYWSVYGASSGAILDLQNRVTTLEEYHTKKIIYVGDSFMSGPGTLITSLNARLNPEAYYTNSRGSTGFVANVADLSFPNQLIVAASDPNINNDEISDIIIAGGINDGYDTTEAQFDSALSLIKSTVATNFTKARVWIIPMLYGTGYMNLNDHRKYLRIVDACLKYGFATYQNADLILRGEDSSIFMQDSVHPSAAGCDRIADYISTWIRGGNIIPDKDVSGTIVNANNDVLGYTGVIKDGLININAILSIRNIVYSAGDPIFELPNQLKNSNASKYIACAKAVTAGSYSGDLYIADGKIYGTASISSVDIFIQSTFPTQYMV